MEVELKSIHYLFCLRGSEIGPIYWSFWRWIRGGGGLG
jgi:hypothetical protein